MKDNQQRKTTLLTVKTILIRKRKLREHIRLLEQQLRHAYQELESGFQARCPHPPEHVHMLYGQYERCREECDICGAEID